MSPPRFALVLAAMALLSLLSASLFHETLPASLEVSTGYINVQIQNAEVVDGGCTIVDVSGNTVSVQVNGQSDYACVIEVEAQNSGTAPARLSRVLPDIPEVQGDVVNDGPVLPDSSGTVEFDLVFPQDFQGTVVVQLQFVMGPLLQNGMGYINVQIQSAEVEEGGHVCTVVAETDEVVYMEVNGQSGDECIIKVDVQNSGTAPARLSDVRVFPDISVGAVVVVDGPVPPGSSGTVKFRLRFLQDFQGTVVAQLQFVMGPP